MGQSSLMKKFVCDECDAEFSVHYDLDEDFYEVYFCPFCSAQIDNEVTEEEDKLDSFPNVEI